VVEVMQKATLPDQKGRGRDRFFHGVTRQAGFWFLALVPIAAAATVLFLVVATGQTQDAVKVSLESKSGVSAVQQTSRSIYSQTSADSLRVAISGVLSPSKTLEYYQELLNYMEQKLGRQVTLTLKPTYAEVNDLIRGKRVDVGFVCTLAYIKGNEDFGMELLVAPQMYGKTVYYSYLIVPEESGARSLRDFRGATFAFTDPLSNSGHLAPTYELSLLGDSPVTFFSKYMYTNSHDNSIVAVADKLVDGAAVDSLVYDQLVASNAELAAKTRVIARWGPYGIPPVVTSPELESQLKQQLQDFFLDLDSSYEGKMLLNKLVIDKFVVIPDDIYDSVREMKTKLGW
jgi:phosphonate transport system substrate-binding protein